MSSSVADAAELTHELNNSIGALRLWLQVLETIPLCAVCASNQAEPLAKIHELIARCERACARVDVLVRKTVQPPPEG